MGVNDIVGTQLAVLNPACNMSEHDTDMVIVDKECSKFSIKIQINQELNSLFRLLGIDLGLNHGLLIFVCYLLTD